MPQIQTTHFGLIDYETAGVIEFPQGLPAFEAERQFILIQEPAMSPVVFLQSLRNAALALPAMPAVAVDPGFQPQPSAEDVASIGCDAHAPVDPESLYVLAVVTISGAGRATANLMAPILIHRERRLAIQSLEPWNGYSHQHALARPGEGTCS
ncbi:MAG: flagellar assembly protein FliW [Bryobacteraceae bacterium]